MTISDTSIRTLLLVMTLELIAVATPLSGQTDRKVEKLADGVYEIQHPDTRNGFAGGNTTVIVGTRQVFVVDVPFLPAEAREDIAQIRQWTDKPVSFVLNTHFHNDHNLANRAYMDAFPAVTIIAHAETKKDMDLFGPGSLTRVERGTAFYQQMLDTGKTGDGTALTDADKAQLGAILLHRKKVSEDLKDVAFQSATLTFDHDFTIDIGDRKVQILFLGRGNTAGDAVVFLSRERIVMAGDLVVHPVPYFYDGYPSEWIHTLENLARLDAGTIVPGHGPVLHDRTYVDLTRDLMQSAVDQMNEALRKAGPAMSRTLDDVKGKVDLTSLRERFAGSDPDLGAAFDGAAAELVKLVFKEASLR
jgi:glyoxylase-like metal-dependent hydrolase (beta-lactamase superfamily II)